MKKMISRSESLSDFKYESVKIPVNRESLEAMLESQLQEWPLAGDNFRALGKCDRRPFKLGEMDCAMQWNPARIVSTAAKTDVASIAERKCLLCSKNRPPEQFSIPFGENWEITVNPYPILPFHFTVVNKEHKPQGEIPLDMISLVEKCRGVCAFFNGAGGGASLPDHEHFQLVLSSELPLLRHLEECGTAEGLPYEVKYFIVTPDLEGMRMIKEFSEVTGYDRNNGDIPSRDLLNAFAWMGADGLLRLAVVPRRSHRPDCYFRDDEGRRLVSPGAIDVAGLLILPDRRDFDTLTIDEIEEIFKQTCISK